MPNSLRADLLRSFCKASNSPGQRGKFHLSFFFFFFGVFLIFSIPIFSLQFIDFFPLIFSFFFLVAGGGGVAFNGLLKIQIS